VAVLPPGPRSPGGIGRYRHPQVSRCVVCATSAAPQQEDFASGSQHVSCSEGEQHADAFTACSASAALPAAVLLMDSRV
jgi:hypothetical protein